MNYRPRIILLALGVLFGYGSAIAHFSHYGGGFRHHQHEHCESR